MELNILSFNVRGLRDFNKRKEIYQYVKCKNCQIVMLQETHSTPEDEIDWKNSGVLKQFSCMEIANRVGL